MLRFSDCFVSLSTCFLCVICLKLKNRKQVSTRGKVVHVQVCVDEYDATWRFIFHALSTVSTYIDFLFHQEL